MTAPRFLCKVAGFGVATRGKRAKECMQPLEARQDKETESP